MTNDQKAIAEIKKVCEDEMSAWDTTKDKEPKDFTEGMICAFEKARWQARCIKSKEILAIIKKNKDALSRRVY